MLDLPSLTALHALGSFVRYFLVTHVTHCADKVLAVAVSMALVMPRAGVASRLCVASSSGDSLECRGDCAGRMVRITSWLRLTSRICVASGGRWSVMARQVSSRLVVRLGGMVMRIFPLRVVRRNNRRADTTS